ncbi:trans-sialidase [Marine Group I thaumarchaeote]|uniref:Trans-sialidase n=1 Tax=Marine Group I thaumarchaeote TaxID=2511932 RepID=A0A7K4N7V1_9ARCH|nr:trans-sialidase [Marine Group I thaumarchaeote]
MAALEAKLNQLSAKIESKPAEAPKPEAPKPEAPKPEAPKPEAPKPEAPKPEAPKPEAPKPEAPKPEPPKPAETTPPPVTFQEALEDAYNNSTMTSFQEYKAKVTGYVPAPNRYFVRLHAPVGKVPTSNWNDQKAKVTGYTQPSNQYFATRQRLAYSPPGKTFGSFSGVNMSVEGIEIKAQAPEPPKPAEVTQQAPPSQQNEGKSKQQLLEEYENNYMQRLEKEKIEQAKAYQEMLETEAKAKSSSNRGSLPKGFESTPEPAPEAAKSSKGTLPKGF